MPEEIGSYANITVYLKSFDYAQAHDETDLFRQSQAANQSCKSWIEDVIADNFDGYAISEEAYNQILSPYGFERTMCILANTIRNHDWDARISGENKTWASGVPIPDYPGMKYLVLNSHPVLIDATATAVRRRYLLSQKRLSTQDVQAEASRILEAFRSLPAPNSPSGKFYTVKISDDFMLRAGSQHTTKLQQYLPFNSLCLTAIKGQKGFYAMIHGSEDRSKPLRTVKPSVRGKLKEPVETPANRQTAKKKERDL